MTVVDDNAQTIGALLRNGREAEARHAVAAALADGRDSDAMLAFAGMLATRAGDPAGAVDYLSKLLRRRPQDRATRLNLANAFIALERYDEIFPLLEAMPQEPAVDRFRAFAALKRDDIDEARRLYRGIVGAVPADADSWGNLASAEMVAGDVSAAVTALEQAITIRRRDVRFYLALADVLDRSERPVERLRVMRDAVAIDPGSADVQLALGLAEAANDTMDAAEASLRRAIELAPDDPAAYLELGLLFETQNRIDALDALIAEGGDRLGAEMALLRAWSAFRAGRIEEADALAQAIPPTVNDLRRNHLLAQLADRRGDAAAAFALFERMNKAALLTSPAVAGPSYREALLAALPSFSKEPDPPIAIHDDGVPTPVFIVGFPRSGTTLTDTLLGCLPETHVLEEQPFIPTIERDLRGTNAIVRLDQAAIARSRQQYRAMLERSSPGASRLRVIDKHPLHMARMPLIDRLFPGAPILLIERHPCDVVLSCFMANFRLNYAMRSFTDIGEAARTYDAVFTAWYEAEKRLALNVCRIRYERLVRDPETELRAALTHIGAEFDPATLDNVAGARERGRIRTASYSQVTEPIYQRAVSRWRRYEKQLAPILPVLAPWAARMGYDM